jgi:hypothetical protein
MSRKARPKALSAREREIRKLWALWPDKNPLTGAYNFFLWVRSHHPRLMDSSKGNAWQEFKGYIG